MGPSRFEGSILSRQKDFLTIPEDAGEDNQDSARNTPKSGANHMDDIAGNILGGMLRDDDSENLLGGNLLKDVDGDSDKLGNHFLEAQSQSEADFQGSDLLKDDVIFDAQVLDDL